MRRLVYLSNAKTEFTAAELDQLLTRAAAYNADIGVTGVLIYAHPTFLQCLEGSAKAVEQVFQRIQGSEAHCNIRLLMDISVDERLFPDWSMCRGDFSDRLLVEAYQALTDLYDPSPSLQARDLVETLNERLAHCVERVA